MYYIYKNLKEFDENVKMIIYTLLFHAKLATHYRKNRLSRESLISLGIIFSVITACCIRVPLVILDTFITYRPPFMLSLKVLNTHREAGKIHLSDI